MVVPQFPSDIVVYFVRVPVTSNCKDFINKINSDFDGHTGNQRMQSKLVSEDFINTHVPIFGHRIASQSETSRN